MSITSEEELKKLREVGQIVAGTRAAIRLDLRWRP
jgi:methionine aminopeptidase